MGTICDIADRKKYVAQSFLLDFSIMLLVITAMFALSDGGSDWLDIFFMSFVFGVILSSLGNFLIYTALLAINWDSIKQAGKGFGSVRRALYGRYKPTDRCGDNAKN